MVESAFSRTPREIWRKIFKYVLAADLPLIKECDENQFETLLNDRHLWTKCHSIRTYFESKADQINLRLVCRSWNVQIAGDGPSLKPSDRLLITDLHGLLLRNHMVPLDLIHRIEIIGNTLCPCEGIFCSGPLFESVQKKSSIEYTKRELSTFHYLPDLKVLFIDGDDEDTLKTDILSKARNLTALSICGSAFFTPSTSDHTLSSTSIAGLTHLAITEVPQEHLTTLALQIFLPNLRLFHLNFISSRPTYDFFDLPGSDPSWWADSTLAQRLPKVSALLFSGAGGMCLMGILSFISQLSETLTELSLTGLHWGDQSRTPVIVGINIRGLVPKIRLYSVRFRELDAFTWRDTDSIQDQIPLAILVTHLWGSWPRLEEDIILEAKGFVEACHGLTCGRIFLGVDWKEYDVLLSREHDEMEPKRTIAMANMPKYHDFFFHYLIASGVGVYDRDQTPYDVKEDVRLYLIAGNLLRDQKS